MRGLVSNIQELEDKLKNGGGAKKIEKQHSDGKLTARERLAHLIDPDGFFLEVGLRSAPDRLGGHAPAGGVTFALCHLGAGTFLDVVRGSPAEAGVDWPRTIQQRL